MPNSTLSQMGFLDEDTQQETVYDIEDTEARSNISTLNNKIGSANGIAELDANGKVPSSQLPSYVDDVVEGYYNSATDRFYEESTFETLITPVEGKSWVDIPANKSYRWTGSVYVRVDEGVQLGETSDTAYAGNKGKANADAITAMKDGSSIDSFGDVETALSNKVDKVTGKGLSTNDYDDTEKDIVDNIQDNVKANTQLIKETVGWSGKNLADSNAQNNTDSYGLTWTVDDKDKNIITVSGTPTGFTAFNVPLKKKLGNGTYILTGAEDVTNATFNTMVFRMGNTVVREHIFVGPEYNKPYEFTITDENDFDNILITLKRIKNDVACSGTFKVMIRKADVVDPTYEPYAGLSAFPREEQEVLGAKNLLKNTRKNHTQNGITFEVDDEGIVNINGTSTNNAYFQFYCDNYNDTSDYKNYLDVTKAYILNGNTQEWADEWYVSLFMRVNHGNNEDTYFFDNGKGVYIDLSKISDINFIHVYCRVGFRHGALTVTNYKIKPMLRLASDTNDNYVPYAMTNKELTDKALSYTHWVSTWGNYIDANTEITLTENLSTKNKLGIVCGQNNANAGMQFFEFDLTKTRSQSVEYLTFNIIVKLTIYYFIIKVENTKITIIETNMPSGGYGIRRVYSD